MSFAWIRDVLWGDGMGSMAHCVADRVSTVLVLSHPGVVPRDPRGDSRVAVGTRVLLRFLNAQPFHCHRLVRDRFVSTHLNCGVMIYSFTSLLLLVSWILYVRICLHLTRNSLNIWKFQGV